MSVTIHLDDALASRLGASASARRVSLEKFVLGLLRDAANRLEGDDQWPAQNRRRIALIRKATKASLTPAEETELQQLQEALTRRLEPVDNMLLEQLDRLKQAVQQLPDEKPE